MHSCLDRTVRFLLAFALPLAPCVALALDAAARPSDLVTLSAIQPLGAACPQGGAAFARTDGATPAAAFEVPRRRVLVVTSVQLVVNEADALDKTALLTAQTASHEQLLTAGALTLDASGDGGASIVIPSGLRVPSGRTVCLRSGAPLAGGYVHGYLAPDR
jgi:hypothetical protein